MLSGVINNIFIKSGLSNLLSQTGFIKLEIAVEASAADNETKQNLEIMKLRCKEEHKHRDVSIKTSIKYCMTRNGKNVKSFLIFKQGTGVQNKWLSGKDLIVFVLMLIIGLPILGMFSKLSVE